MKDVVLFKVKKFKIRFGMANFPCRQVAIAQVHPIVLMNEIMN